MKNYWIPLSNITNISFTMFIYLLLQNLLLTVLTLVIRLTMYTHIISSSRIPLLPLKVCLLIFTQNVIACLIHILHRTIPTHLTKIIQVQVRLLLCSEIHLHIVQLHLLHLFHMLLLLLRVHWYIRVAQVPHYLRIWSILYSIVSIISHKVT